MQAQGIRGYTLVEALIVVALIALLMSAVPSFEKMLAENRQRSRIFEFQRLLQLARASAITSGHVTTLCGSTDQISCTADWPPSSTVLLFEDHNNNHRLDNNESLIYQIGFPSSYWYWRGSNRPYLRFRFDGTPMEFGHFTLCPENNRSATVTQIAVNFVGRAYAKDIPRAALSNSENCN